MQQLQRRLCLFGHLPLDLLGLKPLQRVQRKPELHVGLRERRQCAAQQLLQLLRGEVHYLLKGHWVRKNIVGYCPISAATKSTLCYKIRIERSS